MGADGQAGYDCYKFDSHVEFDESTCAAAAAAAAAAAPPLDTPDSPTPYAVSAMPLTLAREHRLMVVLLAS